MIAYFESQQLSREDAVKILIERYGPNCFLYCKKPISPDDLTIDHWYPQSIARREGWSESKINSIDNFRLSCRKCNSKKGDLVPSDDVTPPVRAARDPFATRAVKRADRPVICSTCENGRLLGRDDICIICGSLPQPYTFPRWAKLQPKDCEHSGPWWCWACSIGIYERQPAIVDVLNGDELD